MDWAAIGDGIGSFLWSLLGWWFVPFAQTPGFAGVFAVVAAIVAYFASTRNAKRERWWKRAEYALNLTITDDESKQLAGMAMLGTLVTKDKQEYEFIRTATDWALDEQARAAALAALSEKHRGFRKPRS